MQQSRRDGKGPEQKEAFQGLKDGCGLEFKE